MIVKIKVLKNDGTELKRFTLAIPKQLCGTIDKLAQEAEMSRHSLIVAILEQVVNDPKFILELKK